MHKHFQDKERDTYYTDLSSIWICVFHKNLLTLKPSFDLDDFSYFFNLSSPFFSQLDNKPKSFSDMKSNFKYPPTYLICVWDSSPGLTKQSREDPSLKHRFSKDKLWKPD